MNVLETSVMGNSIEAWAIALGTTVFSFVILRFVAFHGLRRLLRAASTEKHHWDDVVLAALNATKTGLCFSSLPLSDRSQSCCLAPRQE